MNNSTDTTKIVQNIVLRVKVYQCTHLFLLTMNQDCIFFFIDCEFLSHFFPKKKDYYVFD